MSAELNTLNRRMRYKPVSAEVADIVARPMADQYAIGVGINSDIQRAAITGSRATAPRHKNIYWSFELDAIISMYALPPIGIS